MPHTNKRKNPSPTPPASDIESDNAREVLASTQRMKREIARLRDRLSAATDGKQKVEDDRKTWSNRGRAFARCIATFDFPETLIAEYDRRAEIDEDSATEDEDEEPAAPTREQNRRWEACILLMKQMPSLKYELEHSEAAAIQLIMRHIHHGSDSARAVDTKSMSSVLASWLNPKITKPEDLLDPNSRKNRGFDNDTTGRLLMPIEYDSSDPRTSIDIRSGRLKVTHNMWPAYVFYNARYNPNMPNAGIWRCKLLINACRHLLTSPHSVTHDDIFDDSENQDPAAPPRKRNPTTSKRCVASLMGLEKITPQIIAYVAVQLRVALSNTTHWQETDGDFSYVDFYNNIIDYFACPPGPIAQRENMELLEWWTTKVLKDRVPIHTDAAPPVNSSIARMNASRAAREQGH